LIKSLTNHHSPGIYDQCVDICISQPTVALVQNSYALNWRVTNVCADMQRQWQCYWPVAEVSLHLCFSQRRTFLPCTVTQEAF